MISIKIKFRPSSVPTNEGKLYFQITLQRKTRCILSSCRLFPHEWNEAKSQPVINSKSPRRAYLQSLREIIRSDYEHLKKIARKFEANGCPYQADDVVSEFMHWSARLSFFNHMEGIISNLKQNGRERTSETYRATLNTFRQFRKQEDVRLDCIHTNLIENFQSWNLSRGVSTNTVSFYNRILRAAYNRAVEEGIIENRNPFRHVYTGVDKTMKRALPLPLIKKINKLDLSRHPSLDYARDIFMLSFMLRGMSFIDMAFLKKSDLSNNYIIYRRRKTGQQLVIAWTKEMQSIVDKYPENKTPYLLPIITKTGLNERCAYKYAGNKINNNLKTIAQKVKLSVPLSLYVARHSWASIARSKGVPVSVISEGLGHDSELTTRIYLASLDNSLVDKANHLILNLL